MLESLIHKLTPKFEELSQRSLQNILILVLCILRKETVCLNKLKGTVGTITGHTSVKPSSNYKRLIRIFRNHSFSSLWIKILCVVLELLRLKTEYLTLDGTSWKRGSKWHHFLTLCIVYKQVAIPIYWVNLNKQGISNIKERKNLLKRALKRFNLKHKILLADREYIGISWFKYLIDNEIDFVIRLKSKAYKSAINKAEGRTLDEMIAKVKRSKIPNKSVKKAFELNGLKLYVIVIKNPKKNAKEDILFLITNIDKPAASIAAMYPIRWSIEHCFKQLKSNGFQLEVLNLKGKARQNLMMAIVVFAYVLSVLEGLKQYAKIAIKKYKDGTSSKEVSVFRNGIDKLMVLCSNFDKFINYIVHIFEHNHKAYSYQNWSNVQ